MGINNGRPHGAPEGKGEGVCRPKDKSGRPQNVIFKKLAEVFKNEFKNNVWFYFNSF